MKLRNLLDLSGKVALITGGSRGLGLQMAEALGEMGARLALIARKAEELAQARAHLAGEGIEAYAVVCDIAQAQAVAPMVDRVLGQYGRIDILINNAGTLWRGPAEDHPPEDWDKVMGLNLTGTFLVSQAVGKRSMIPQRYGRIINVASTLGLRGNRVGGSKSVAYNTSKGGLLNFTRALAGEWGAYNITVNAIAPGLFPSRMSESVLGKNADIVVGLTPSGRLGGEDDLKGLAVLLASDASRHISGQIIAVDGGASAV